MRENCKAVVARPTTVPIMSQSYLELHGLPNPSPCTVHKPHCGPYPNHSLPLSLVLSLFLSPSPTMLPFLLHIIIITCFVTFESPCFLTNMGCVCVWVDLRFGAWLAWRVLGSNLRVAASQHCRQSVSQSVCQNITQALSVKNATSDMWDIIPELSKWQQCSLWNPVKCPSNTRNSWAPHAPHWCKCQEA